MVSNCVLAGMQKNFQDAQAWSNGSVLNSNDPGTFAYGYFNRSDLNNGLYATAAELGFTGDPFSLTNPGVFINPDSPLATGASFTHSKVSSGFQNVAYKGAFGPTETASSNWTTGWANFDPQNTKY